MFFKCPRCFVEIELRDIYCIYFRIYDVSVIGCLPYWNVPREFEELVPDSVYGQMACFCCECDEHLVFTAI